jgi:hypothetical protein
MTASMVIFRYLGKYRKIVKGLEPGTALTALEHAAGAAVAYTGAAPFMVRRGVGAWLLIQVSL